MRLPLLGIGLCAVLFAFPGVAQTNTQRYAADNYRPTTPGAYSLLKYVDNPTDLYHGMPQISVPIYTLQVGKKSFPLALDYHAGGVRVTEEASWAGLGWDLTLPTVVQAINDEDDLTPNPTPYYTIPRRRPDWPLAASSYTIALPKRHSSIHGTVNQSGSVPDPNWTNPYPSSGIKPTPQAKHYYKSFLEYYIPVDTNFDVPQQQMLTEQVDSEPDIFTISLFGNTIQCARDFVTGNITVLNQSDANYTVTGGATNWYVRDGEGYAYWFSNRSVHKSAVSDVTTYAIVSTPTTPSMVVWYLQGITSPDGHQATFTYSQPYSERVSIDFKQKCQWAVRDNAANPTNIGEAYQTPPNVPSGYARSEYPTHSYTYETKTYLQSLTCDNVAIDFFASARQDIDRAQKLDSVRLYDPYHATVLKRMVLTYDYFQSAAVGATYSTLDGSGADTQRNDLRLRLTRLKESTTGTYQFTYDAEPLPVRNSFAQDFWGYYNGATSNVSLVPSTQRLGVYTSIIPDNGNNNGAVLQYARAGTLTGVLFPTGGRKQFEYELNMYDSRDLENNPVGNSHLPDYDSLNNKVIKGNGLRVKRITSYPVVGEPLLTEYTYYQGRTMLPRANYRSIVYNLVTFTGGYNGANAQLSPYTIYEITSNFQYSPALIGSGTGIGYGRVEERQRLLGSTAAQPKGTTVYYYANQPDVDRINDTGFYSAMAGQLYAATQISLPACQNTTTKQNGLVDSVKYYSENGQLLRKTLTTYRTVLSPIDYGVKFFSGGVYYEASQNSMDVWAKYYVGYYPIYGKRSSKLSESTIEYGTDGTSFGHRTAYALDSKDRVVTKQDQNYALTAAGTPASFAPGVTYTYTYPDVRRQPGDQALLAYGHLAQPVVLTEVHAVDAAIHPGVSGQVYTYEKFYGFHSPSAGLDSVVETTAYPTGPSVRRKVTRYKGYDAKLRPAQVTASLEGPTAYLWYDQLTIPTAIVRNAPPTTVVYTSFEDSQSLTGWSQFVPTVPGGVTGKFCQPLSNGLTSPSLPTGTYAFSYWARGYSAVPTVTGGYQLRQHQTASRADGWVQYQGTLTPTGASAGTVALQFAPSATGLLDEVRLHPMGAQMVSFTYGPWQTTTSQTDAAGRISIYEYDTAGRLERVRDEQGRILTQEQYHYAGQP